MNWLKVAQSRCPYCGDSPRPACRPLNEDEHQRMAVELEIAYQLGRLVVEVERGDRPKPSPEVHRMMLDGID